MVMKKVRQRSCSCEGAEDAMETAYGNLNIVSQVAAEKRGNDAMRRRIGLQPIEEGVVRLSSISALLTYAGNARKSLSYADGKLFFEAYGVRFEALPEGEVVYRG